MHSTGRGSLGKRWCFTSFEDAEPTFKEGTYAYLCYGREVCPTSGRPHWQGYVYLSKRMYLNGLKGKADGPYHFELAKGSVAQNISYCSKDGKFTEHGVRPLEATETGGQATKKKWLDVRKRAELGQFDCIESEIYVKHARTLHFIHDEAKSRGRSQQRPTALLAGQTAGAWLYGPPGCGNPQLLEELVETHCTLKPLTNGGTGTRKKTLYYLKI